MIFLIKKHGLKILASLLVIGGLFVLFESKNDQSIAKENGNLLVEKTQNIITSKDADGDGLLDWEEALWGSNAQNSDTDEDGTNDNDEVKNGRHPAIKGPNDKVNEIMKAGQKSATPKTEQEKLTDTNKFARDFFTKYLAFKRSGASVADNQEFLVENLLNKTNLSVEFKQYDSRNILIGAEEDSASVRKYGNRVGEIFTKRTIENGRNELEIVEDGLKNESEKILKEMDPIITAYLEILANLEDTVAPKNLTKEHIKLLNAVSMHLSILQDMRLALSDPLRAVAGISKYFDGSDALSEAFYSLNAAFARNIVNFANNEPGYYISYIVNL